MESGRKIGINGLGRIGKMTLWHLLADSHFSEIVVNIGREVGTAFKDLIHFVEKDSTYGQLSTYLYGCKGGPVVTEVDEADKRLVMNDISVKFLMNARNPREIAWADHEVSLVLDATGRFLDPTLPPEDPKGSCRGHLEAGAHKVITSAPFKIKDKTKPMPDDAVTLVMGVNEHKFDPAVHSVVSNASCTTNCLAHMVKPLLDHFGIKRVLSASMATVHAATGSQNVLDRLPGTGDTDLRKSRSIMNNIILTSTGAARALALVIPEMKKIGFMAESVRIPTSTGSLIILVVNLQEEEGEPIRRDTINRIYQEASLRDSRGYLRYTEEQNVSSDIIAYPKATTIIEGHETHTRTAMAMVDLSKVRACPASLLESLAETHIEVPITQTVIYGWYDNELASYVRALCDCAVYVDQLMET